MQKDPMIPTPLLPEIASREVQTILDHDSADAFGKMIHFLTFSRSHVLTFSLSHCLTVSLSHCLTVSLSSLSM